MKKTVLFPLALGLLLVACTRTEAPKTASTQAPANPPPDATPTTLDDSVKKNATPTPQVATTPVPANPTAPDSRDTTSSVAKDAIAAGKSTLPEIPPAPAPAADLASNPKMPPAPRADLLPSDATLRSVAVRIAEWKLKGDDIKDEFQASGKVERAKAPVTGEPTGPMDGILTGLIGGKLQNDTEISGQKIEVEADKGVVTLTGTAHSLDQIGRAVALALDTQGVSRAISQIKLETNP